MQADRIVLELRVLFIKKKELFIFIETKRLSNRKCQNILRVPENLILKSILEILRNYYYYYFFLNHAKNSTEKKNFFF